MAILDITNRPPNMMEKTTKIILHSSNIDIERVYNQKIVFSQIISEIRVESNTMVSMEGRSRKVQCTPPPKS